MALSRRLRKTSDLMGKINKMIRRRVVQGMLAAFALAASAQGALADDTDAGEVLHIQVANGDASEHVAAYGIEDLKAMPTTVVRTQTIWTDGVQEFTGVLLADLLNQLGISGGMLDAVAINDYLVEIPVSDAIEGGPIIAYMRNGALMSVRDKGPLWVIYPYDSNLDYQRAEIYARSIWQLNHLIHNP